MDINERVTSWAGPGCDSPQLHQTSSHLGDYGAELGSTDCERACLYLGELPPLSVQIVQLQMTIVLQWRWQRKQLQLLKLNSLGFAA